MAKVTTEVRASDWDMDTGEAGDGTCDTPMGMTMDMAMEMGTAVTPTATGTASTATLELTERNENGKRRRRSEVPVSAVGHGNWRSRMERTAQPQSRELAQLD
jgi:hypothetical protein